MTILSDKLLNIRSTFSLPVLEEQIKNLSTKIDEETDVDRKNYLCAAYQALMWARQPDGYAAPTEY